MSERTTRMGGVTVVDVRPRTKVKPPAKPKGKAGRLVERMGATACKLFWTLAAAGLFGLLLKVVLD